MHSILWAGSDMIKTGRRLSYPDSPVTIEVMCFFCSLLSVFQVNCTEVFLPDEYQSTAYPCRITPCIANFVV